VFPTEQPAGTNAVFWARGKSRRTDCIRWDDSWQRHLPKVSLCDLRDLSCPIKTRGTRGLRTCALLLRQLVQQDIDVFPDHLIRILRDELRGFRDLLLLVLDRLFPQLVNFFAEFVKLLSRLG